MDCRAAPSTMKHITTLEPNVDLIEADGRSFYLVGTAHVSRGSAELVERIIREKRPDTVCLELCDSRYETLSNPERWRETDIYSIIKSGRAYVLMAQLALSTFQRKIAETFGIRPGEEMLTAIRVAHELDMELSLVDREVRITLKRAWARASLWSLVKICISLVGSVFGGSKITQEEIEQLKASDALTVMMEEFSGSLPGVKAALIDERDQYLAAKILSSPGSHIVAVVGAGHVPGIKRFFGTDVDIEGLERTPPPRSLNKIIGWAVPILIVALIATGFVVFGRRTGEEMIVAWVLANGIFASAGTLIALAHPLTIMTAFIAAPLTSLSPAIAAGWVCGLVEAWRRKPRVRDLENVAGDLASVRGIWRNRVTRVLLVVVLANLGSAIGTLAGAGWVVTLLGG